MTRIIIVALALVAAVSACQYLDVLMQTVSLANAQTEAVAPSSRRRGSGRAGTSRVLLATRAVCSAAVHKLGAGWLLDGLRLCSNEDLGGA
jgi:hypothetical protein